MNLKNRISFSTAGMYPRDTYHSVKILSETGFKEVEIMPQCRFETTPDFAERISGIDIHVTSYHYPLVLFSTFYNEYGGMIEENKTICRNLADSAGILNSNFIVIHPPYNNANDSKDDISDVVVGNIRFLADVCFDRGVKIALENNPNSNADNPNGLLQMLGIISHRNVFPMVDVTESYEAGIDPVDFIDKTKPKHMHLSDYKGSKKHILPGEGDFDWKGIILKLKNQNYDGSLVIEPSYRYMREDFMEKLSKQKSFFENLL